MVHGLIGTGATLVVGLALALKWQLGVRRVAFALLVFGAAAGAAVAGLALAVPLGLAARSALTLVLALGAGVAVLAWRFYRDPERTPPIADNVIVSPADGEIVYVRRTTGGCIPASSKHGREYPLEELTRTQLHSCNVFVIGVAMSFLDVHVNRAPINGRITLRQHFPGLFGSLRDPEMVFRNERATTVIEREGFQVAVVQIASRLVRQIASFVNEGQNVALGERIGVIRLGSQVDVVLPDNANLEILVQSGQRVRAGESILARLN